MKAEMVQEILNDVATCDGEYSLGFRRYIHLPDVVRCNMNLAYLLLTGKTDTQAPIKAFLSELSDEEYRVWLLQQNA